MASTFRTCHILANIKQQLLLDSRSVLHPVVPCYPVETSECKMQQALTDVSKSSAAWCSAV